MANFGGVYFLPFFPKTTLSASKWQFLEKISTFVGFRGKIAVLRHLEDFLGKMEKSRLPLKLKNKRSLLSSIFLIKDLLCKRSQNFTLTHCIDPGLRLGWNLVYSLHIYLYVWSLKVLTMHLEQKILTDKWHQFPK